MFEEVSRDFKFLVQVIEDQNSGTQDVEVQQHIYRLECTFIADPRLTRNTFEEKVLNSFVNTNISIDMNGSYSMALTSHRDPRALEDDTQRQVMKVNYKLSSSSYFTSDVLSFAHTVTVFLRLSKVLLCPLIKFKSFQYNMTSDISKLPPSITLTVDFNVTRVVITGYEDLNMVDLDEDGGLLICQELLEKHLKQFRKADKILEGTTLAKYVLSILCFVASLVCLLLTLLAYWMFPVLRTGACINNMFLAFSLLLAQTSLLASSHM